MKVRMGYKVVGKPLEAREIEDDYKVIQELCGGFFSGYSVTQFVDLPELHNVVLYCNDTGKLDGLAPNCYKFVTAGKTYNLGAVSDKITGGDEPSGGAPDLGWFDLLCKWLEQVTGVPAWVWKIIICALPFVILLPILSAIFPIVGQILSAVLKGIGTAFVWLCKGVFWIICLPFKGIAALVRKIRNKGEQSHA